MATRIRTLNFLPEIFKTPTNAQFLGATLDQLVAQPNIKKIEGYIGTKFGYGINAKDYYVTEPTKTRTDYQLDPGVIFLKKDTNTSQDFISYPGIIDGLNLEGSLTADNNRLFNSQFYSWDSFTDLDKIINFNQYYWIPEGPDAVLVSTAIVFESVAYTVTDVVNGYNIDITNGTGGTVNPTLTLLRGGTYTFAVNQTGDFWIQGSPGITGYDPTQTNMQTRDVLGVDNNGASTGFVTFTVPLKTAQDQYNFPSTINCGVVSTLSYDQVNGVLLSQLGNIDGITSLDGLTILFYNIANDAEVSSTLYTISYTGDLTNPTITLTTASAIPTNVNIIPQYGVTWIGRTFYKNTLGVITLIPYLSAIKDILYYQDGTSANKVGILKLIDSNTTNTLDIITDIIDKQSYTSPNGVVFTNGLKVIFSGNIYPTSYKIGSYYVEGVGTAIKLINVTELISHEPFTQGLYIPFDTLPFDIGNYDSNLYIPILEDYITIARNSINRNPWSRSNRWFHIDVITATATYNNDSSLISLYATPENKAKRPIIEFYPNLRLFNSGALGKPPVDFVDFRTTDAFSLVAGQENYYPDIQVYTEYTATIGSATAATSTTITIAATNITGTFEIGQYITDSTNLLPNNTQITDISGTTTLTITVEWAAPQSFNSTAIASIVGSDTTVDNYALFDGAKIIFAADTTATVRNKIYISRFSIITGNTVPVITLTEASDGLVLLDEQTVALRGFNNQGLDFYYNGTSWLTSQQKTTVNQPPLFDVFDKNSISFGNSDYYIGTSFIGTKLFAYGIGTGLDDNILGFPLRYSSVNNVGDISFDVSLNIETFNYVEGSIPVTKNINTGYVYNYSTSSNYIRELGWQTAVAPSIQYQIFEFNYTATTPTYVYTCDIAVNESTSTAWPTIQLYVNNVIQSTTSYTYTVTANSTIVDFNVPNITLDTVIQILLLSDQVSETAYYSVPINLNNNPLNEEIKTANIGDIRSQYQSIFYNSPNTTGDIFGSNNYRDLGNLVPYGNAIIQNSASLVLPGTFLRKQNHNLFNALMFNSKEYVTFKTLLVDTVNNTEYSVFQSAASMLDDALDQITASKTDSDPFFWSDMLPSKAAYITNTYSFANSLDVSIYPLSRIYNFATANYYGVLVYLTRTVNSSTKITQLITNADYTVSTDSPSLTITLDLLPGDQITINEYTQTYGSYIPNTPTKLGLYPSTIPNVILDTSYSQPTYFILGHDGSYNKLYGTYTVITGKLVDFRDQVLLEFEKRIYNNLKLSATIPIQEYEVLPGFFRETDYGYNEILEIYSTSFLNWVGQNRINYKTQTYTANNEFTYNYYQSGNRINRGVIEQGNWRGVYKYYYDTGTPESTPWEMLGFANKPTWWESRYGAAPYTSDNLVLWNDLAQGIDWNNGTPIVIVQAIRPQLLQVLPVNSAGELVSPFVSIVGNYTNQTFNRDWKVGDLGPAEYSYRKSSTWPFDLMRILALTKPAEFFNLAVDLDNYKYNVEFNQYLVNDRSHLIINDIEIYGSGTAKTSYINWIVDYEKQLGVDATTNITQLLNNLDVRLVYRLAGFSDKNLLKFYVEKGTPNSRNASLLIPDESFAVLLYDNQPFDKIIYSGIIVQVTTNGYKVFGNSQTNAYFKTLQPKINGNYDRVTVEKLSVQLANNYADTIVFVPYGTEFYTVQEVSQFIDSYGRYLALQGALFEQIESGLKVSWRQMVSEFLYWAQTGWEVGCITNINPAATLLTIDKDSNIVQPLTIQQQNFVLNQNLYPIQSTNLSVVRDGTFFSAQPLNPGDTIAYGQFNISNFEHGIVFDNITVFDDIIYNLITGLRQDRIVVRGTKTAEWNGTIDAQGFILNQDNIQEWTKELKYTAGSIVKYKNKYWIALVIVQAKELFDERDWKVTDYNEIQKGLLPNTSTNSYESTLYYDVNKANLENDADLLSFSLIGFRPRDYMALADLTDITQVNVYKNLIKNKGTLNAASAFKGATLAQGGIDYNIYENWAIKTSEFGGVLNSNFIEFRLNQTELTGNPSIVGLTNGIFTTGVQQEVPLYSLFNYGRPISDPNVLPTINTNTPSTLFPDAGYANFNDVKMSSYFYSGLPLARNASGTLVPLSELYVRDYVWLANQLGTWQIYTPVSLGQIIGARNNINNTVTIQFQQQHNLTKYQSFAIVNFNANINGYYIANAIVDPFRVIITLNLNPQFTTITGQGVGFKFQSQRVTQPSEIVNLPLLDSEFVKNKVWVDENTDGGWAVYRKSINYAYDAEIIKPISQTFGSAVAYTSNLGYLISDAAAGEVYRYSFNELTLTYQLMQTITNDTTFGTTITYVDEIFAISQPTASAEKVYIYELITTVLINSLDLLQEITAPGGVTNWGSSLALSGDKNWLYISDIDNNSVYAYRRSALTGEYEVSHIIDGDSLSLTVSGDNFGYSITTDYYGDTIVISAPDQNYSATIDNWGYTYVFDRTVQNLEAQYTSLSDFPQLFTLAWTPTTVSTVATGSTGGSDIITCASTAGFVVDDPVIFSGTILSGSGLSANKVYYIKTIPGGGITFTVSTTRGGTVVDLATTSLGAMVVTVQSTPLFVNVNGTQLDDNTYAVIGSTLNVLSGLNAGDIVNVSGNNFILAQTLTTETTPRVGVQFGQSVDTTQYASEIIIGAPFELGTQNHEGAIYRFTNGGAKYGIIIGTSDCTLASPITVLLNGYSVTLPIGNATTAANSINSARITNIQAAATTDNKLIIQLIDISLATPNNKLTLAVLASTNLATLGLPLYTQTQVINCPHLAGATQFGSVVQFNEIGSFVASAPTGTRFSATTFDYTDDENLDNDTLFDNNTTQWVDTYTNAGAVYMFDYLPAYNESLLNIGNFVYAQSVNAKNEDYGAQPLYGYAIDFNASHVIIGTPNFRPGYDNGQVISYINSTGNSDWAVYRVSDAVVDINRIQDIQLYSALTNTTLDNLDYIDPLQGKILGSVRENIDVVSNIDPAGYNTGTSSIRGSLVWGADKVGQLWFNTSTTRFVNYHQTDIVYNSKYWGTVFPGSDVTVYSWITSINIPSQYAGPGTPYDVTSYTTEYIKNSTGELTPIYFYWVRNTNIVFTQIGKTLSDRTVQSYITSPINSGISYFAPIQPNIFALYNSGQSINATDTVLHIGFATGTNDDVSHSLYSLVRANYADDFLPGLPGTGPIDIPESLYDRMLDSMCGVDESGGIVPNPYLPKAVQYGILARPRQSFFVSRFGALKNYLTYANEVLAQYPITETRRAIFLYALGTINPSNLIEFYDTTKYWSYINWWATGYNNNTKAAVQVSIYADLSTLTSTPGLIATVLQNGDGKSETYVYTSAGFWNRIGLQNGTIEFNSSLWDYETYRLGFGDNFFDTTPYDEYPSAETRYIIRALNEEIYTNELLIHRNKSLILLFEYAQSEIIESQNFLPWLNKTSFIDVSHTIRELLPLEVFRSDNQDFLSGYLNEVKPYHVVIKEFIFKYTGNEVYEGDITDFDLPAQYNTSYEQFITPELVYGSSSATNQYSLTDPIWQTAAYSSWYNNYGLSISSVTNYKITTTASYVSLNSSAIAVNNAFGFPINGIIQVANELIGYSSVDRALSILTGLTRGVNGTPISIHLPGENIFIDLPAVLVLDGGRGYTEPPKITAYIDTDIYPAPRKEAVLVAVMDLDSILSIDVIDPGEGYAVLPNIRIAPSISISFLASQVNVSTNTILLQQFSLQTGDLVQYLVGDATTSVGGLKNGSYYYVNVLQTAPVFIIALYSNYANSLNNQDRVILYSTGTGNNNYLNLSARASCVTTSIPVRENQLSLKFDRLAYNSRVVDWETNKYYGSFYVGNQLNRERISSSSITLASSTPEIYGIAASAQGVAFEITAVDNNEELVWSSRTRIVTDTTAITNAITIAPSEGGAPDEGAVGPTTGFYVGMPVKFLGAVIGNLVNDTIYYVKTIIDLSNFTVSASSVDGVPGTVFVLISESVSAAGLTCYVGDNLNKTIVSIAYPGISIVTGTTAVTNNITAPLNTSGLQGGTRGMYPGLSIIFTGNILTAGNFVVGNTYIISTLGTTDFISCGALVNKEGTIFVATNIGSGTGTVSSMFGNIIENEFYYVTTVTSLETFTMSTSNTAIRVSVTETESGTNLITCSSSLNFAINDPIIFNNMIIDGAAVNSFGNIIYGTTYYVSSLFSGTQLSISSVINGGVFALSTQAAAEDTGCTLTNQKDIVQLTTAIGAITMNVGLPVSPGQINGQEFIFYGASNQYAEVTGTNTTVVERKITNALATGDYYTITSASGGLTALYINMPFNIASAFGGLLIETTYYIIDLGTITAEITATTSGTNLITCNTTAGFYVAMPLMFSNTSIGEIELDTVYYVKTVDSLTTFTISATSPGGVPGTVVAVTTGTALGNAMIATGTPYINLSTSLGGSSVAASNAYNYIGVTLTQTPTDVPEFTIGWSFGGYTTIISSTNPGQGYAVNNVITIAGTNIGGTSANNLYLTVNDITELGEILTVIGAGDPNDVTENFYLQVISATQCEVYYNALLTLPVNANDFTYEGVRSTNVSATESGTNIITVTSTIGYVENDPVIFTGITFGDIVLGDTYYILTIESATELTISETPAGVEFILSDDTGSCTMAKAGDFILLPEPFYFNQSIVKYNNNVYQCLISNNDPEFIFGKWELLTSGDRQLNALDRIVGYYAPTINMPGLDLTQLVSGITYPNSTYLGNAFAPDDEYLVDTILTDQQFSPTAVNTKSIVWNGDTYIAASNTPDYSAIITSVNTNNWAIEKVSTQSISITDLTYSGDTYVITTTNSATPLLVSSDAVVWTTAPTIIAPTTTLNSVTYFNGIYVAVGYDILASTDAINWVETYVFVNFDPRIEITNTLRGVTSAVLEFFTGFIAVGAGQQIIYPVDGNSTVIDYSLVLISVDGTNWTIPAAQLPTTEALNAVAHNAILVAVGDNGIRYTSINGSNWIAQTAPNSYNLNDVIYANSLFVAVGDSGSIQTSDDDGVTWLVQTSGTGNHLNGITYNDIDLEFVIVGNNNTILKSNDGLTWTSTSLFITDPTVYNVQGDPFLSGYGPEELVPGVVSDNLTMIIATRPGTNWESTVYQHVGYNVVSIEITPENELQTIYSFYNAVQTPAQLAVYIINETTNLCTAIYNEYDYNITWANETLELISPLTLGDSLRIDIYEVGNGNQLVKASTQTDPIRINTTTGFNEIYVNCNYIATQSAGSGVIQTGTPSLEFLATATDAVYDTITCDNVNSFVLNYPITFQGEVFGNIETDTIYYVKTISYITNQITVSLTVSEDHNAGPTFQLVTDFGSMDVIIQTGGGLVWTPPSVYHNGQVLTLGITNKISATISGRNTVVCNTTGVLSIDDPIVFSDTIFGGIIQPQVVYYINSIFDGNEFTISETFGGSILYLTDATGGAIAINNDYAIGLEPNGISASLIFAAQYDAEVDYITYTLFGETTPIQYGWTLPEIEIFIGDGSQFEFTLAHNITGDNPTNAVVEINGLRVLYTTDYTINSNTAILAFTTVPADGDKIAITSYNLTDRQYFNTQFDITNKTVANIIAIDNAITPALAIVTVTNTAVTTNLITGSSTANFVIGQPIIFSGTGFGNINTTGTVYYIKTITIPLDGTFTISETSGGSTFVLTSESGTMVATVGGTPAVRVTTGINHNFSNNDSIRIDGTVGSTQLNNNTYYARVINSTQFDLYSAPYVFTYGAANEPITEITAYISSGYTWLDKIYTLITTVATDTTTSTNKITVSSTAALIVDTPIIFTGTTLGGIVAGTTYYVKEKSDATNFKITETRGGDEFELSTAGPGSFNVTQWEQENVDRLWVTINGYRVPSSLLYLNPNNELSILSTITTTDIVIITSMIPSATPNEDEYMQNVNKNNIPSVYRANTLTRTWLTAPLFNTDSIIYVDDVSRITDTIIQNVIAPAAIDDIISVGLIGDKNTISQIIVYNISTTSYVNTANYSIAIEDLAPILKLTAEVSEGDAIVITTIVGNLIYINGEQIKFTTVDLAANTLTGLQRGANGTGEQTYIPLYSELFGILPANKLDQALYYTTWNSYDYNTTSGDPLQISNTDAAVFLNGDIS